MEFTVIENHLDEVFEDFYHYLLSDNHFAGFFPDDKMVLALIDKQRDNFRQAMHDDRNELKQRFVSLGRMHHHIFVPYPDFVVGMDFLAERIYKIMSKEYKNACFAHDAFNFFKHIKDFTAKGYLDCILEEDKQALNVFLGSVQGSKDTANKLIEAQLKWLLQVLKSLEKEDEELLPALIQEDSELYQWLLSDEAEEYIPSNDDRINLFNTNRRIYTDTENLFYFIKNEHYAEVLAMYTKISKHLLSLNNILTVFITQHKMRELVKDPLTGLLNRKTLDEVLKQEIRLASLTRKPLTVVLTDLDHFKSVNDTHGHLAGDAILKQSAELMQTCLRGSDYAFRYGGEEFLLVLNNTDGEGARIVAEKCREQIAAHEFDTGSGVNIKVTSSFGLATLDSRKPISALELIECADKRLYEAKEKGRNRVEG